ELLRRHVARRPQQRTALRQVLSRRRIAGGGRESEVQYFHRTTDRDLDVRWLQVAMDNPLLMSGLERFRDLPRDRERPDDRQSGWMGRDPVRQRLALDELHHDRARTTIFLDAVDVRDIRMIERGQELRFALE